MTRVPWHRVFHPLSGADPVTLLRLLRHGPPSPGGASAYAVALAASVGRLPFTLAEGASAPLRREPDPPVFIVGHPRSGTTHLHNLMAASGRFAVVPPVMAGMPWEARGLARVMRPFINLYLPETRLIDRMPLAPDSPTEDEVALANMCGLSYFHALYFPRDFAATYARGLLFEGADPTAIEARGRALRRFATAMARPRRGPLLLKNPAYTAQVGWLRALFPGARVVHIHRDPEAVFASARRGVRTVLRELALQRWDHVDVDEAILATYPRMMEALLAEARARPEGIAQVSLEALTADPLGELAAIWGALDLPAPEASLAAIGRHLAGAEGYRQAPADLTQGERHELARRWGPWLERFGRAASAAGPRGFAPSGGGRGALPPGPPAGGTRAPGPPHAAPPIRRTRQGGHVS